jgi:flagellar assembly factor FliW
VKITTTRFGEITVDERRILKMRGGILGFEHLREFILLIYEDGSPLWWLQSVEDPVLAFVVINPRIALPNYNPQLPASDLELLEISNYEDIALLSIVTVRSQPFRVTTNLRAPILINALTRTANQVVLDDGDYPIQYDLVAPGENQALSSDWEPAGTGRLVKLASSLALP